MFQGSLTLVELEIDKAHLFCSEQPFNGKTSLPTFLLDTVSAHTAKLTIWNTIKPSSGPDKFVTIVRFVGGIEKRMKNNFK